MKHYFPTIKDMTNAILGTLYAEGYYKVSVAYNENNYTFKVDYSYLSIVRCNDDYEESIYEGTDEMSFKAAYDIWTEFSKLPF